MNNKVYAAVIAILCIGLVSSLAGAISLHAKNAKLEEKVAEAEVAVATAAPEVDPVLPPTIVTRVVTNVIVKAVAVEDLSDELAERDKMVEELNRKLLDAQAKLAQAQKTREELRGERRAGRTTRWSEYTEKMKKDEPERFAAMQKERAERTAAVKETMNDQYGFLYSLDTSSMTEEQLVNHEKLMKILEDSWQQMQNVETAEGAEGAGWKSGRALMVNMWKAGELLDAERDVALVQMGESMGYTGDEASEFAAAVKYVNDMTSIGTYFRGIGGRGGRGRGMFGRRGEREEAAEK